MAARPRPRPRTVAQTASASHAPRMRAIAASDVGERFTMEGLSSRAPQPPEVRAGQRPRGRAQGTKKAGCRSTPPCSRRLVWNLEEVVQADLDAEVEVAADRADRVAAAAADGGLLVQEVVDSAVEGE